MMLLDFHQNDNEINIYSTYRLLHIPGIDHIKFFQFLFWNSYVGIFLDSLILEKFSLFLYVCILPFLKFIVESQLFWVHKRFNWNQTLDIWSTKSSSQKVNLQFHEKWIPVNFWLVNLCMPYIITCTINYIIIQVYTLMYVALF